MWDKSLENPMVAFERLKRDKDIREKAGLISSSAF